ncbi:MAG: TorF family putative porin [Woeseiaceae bacterium]|nr:TorF family putative porin [Woeseiaceae bacterium]
MKTIHKAGLAATLLAASSVANAGWSANLGFASDYYFRGIFQKSASASGGIDYESSNGFYVGTWVADVGGDIAGDGLEVDVYGGWGGSTGDFSYGVGFTGYYYTGEFDDTYQEVNLSFGYSWLTIDAAIGEYDASPDTLDYQFYSATIAHNGFWAQYGTFQDDFEGDYVQFGYDVTLTEAEIDFGVSLLLTDDNAVGENEEALILTIGKSFDL